MQQLICRRVVVSGRVQGVGFRWHTRERARELGLAGWVRNLPDGRVEVWVEGPEERVRAMLDWLERGPSWAEVSATAVSSPEPAGLAGFEVRRGE